VRGTVFGKVSLGGATAEEIDRLRVITVTQADVDDAAAGEGDAGMAEPPARWKRRGRPAASCVICCEDFELGERARVLPCLHRMHVRCIDPWLLLKAECPVCHESARKGLSAEVLAVVKSLNEAALSSGALDYGAMIRSAIASHLPDGEDGVEDVLTRYEEVTERLAPPE